MVTFGVVTVIIFTIVLGDGKMTGYDYCWFKAVWATFVATCIFPFCHFSAVTVSKFPDFAAAQPLLGDNATTGTGQANGQV